MSRAALVKDERHLDRFDHVFASVFNGLDGSAGAIVAEIPEEWLRRLTEKFLTDEEKRLGTRNIKLALRKFAREGAPEELDLHDTLDREKGLSRPEARSRAARAAMKEVGKRPASDNATIKIK